MGDNEEYQEITEGWSGIKEREGGREGGRERERERGGRREEKEDERGGVSE